MISAWPIRTIMGFQRFTSTGIEGLNAAIRSVDPERKSVTRRPVVLSATHLLVDTLLCGQYKIGAGDLVLLHVVLIRNERIELFYELIRNNDSGVGEMDVCDAEVFISLVAAQIADFLGLEYHSPKPLSV